MDSVLSPRFLWHTPSIWRLIKRISLCSQSESVHRYTLTGLLHLGGRTKGESILQTEMFPEEHRSPDDASPLSVPPASLTASTAASPFKTA